MDRPWGADRLGGSICPKQSPGLWLRDWPGLGGREGRGAVPGMETQRKNKLREMLKRVSVTAKSPEKEHNGL